MSPATAQPSRIHQLAPLVPVMVFTTVVTGWFNLSEVMPTPLAVTVGAGWGAALGLLGLWVRNKARLGAVGFAFAGCGGLMAILMLNGTIDSSSLTGETLESTFMPSIPYYIVVNSALELVIVPGRDHAQLASGPAPHPGPRRGPPARASSRLPSAVGADEAGVVGIDGGLGAVA